MDLGLPERKGWRERRDPEFKTEMYTLLYLKQVTNKDLLGSTWNSAQCYVPGWDGSLGENGYMYMAGSLHSSPDTITTLLTD